MQDREDNLTSTSAPNASAGALELTIHHVEVYNDEKSAQTFADKLKNIQAFQDENLRRDERSFYGTYPKNSKRTIQERYHSILSQRMFVSNSVKNNTTSSNTAKISNNDGTSLARSFKNNPAGSSLKSKKMPESDITLGSPYLDTPFTTPVGTHMRNPSSSEPERAQPLDPSRFIRLRGDKVPENRTSAFSSGYGTMGKSSFGNAYSSAGSQRISPASGSYGVGMTPYLEPIEHCEAEVIVDSKRGPVGGQQTVSGASTSRASGTSLSKDWLPISQPPNDAMRSRVNTPQLVEEEEQHPKYMSVLTNSMDLSAMGIIDSLEDDYDVTDDDSRNSIRCQSVSAYHSFRHIDSIVSEASDESSKTLMSSGRLHSRTLDINAIPEDENEEERDSGDRADTLRLWHQNAQIFESVNARREKEITEKLERYKRNILCAAEEIISTEKSYNMRIHLLGSTLKQEADKDPIVADFFKKGRHGIQVLHTVISHFQEMASLSDGILYELEKTWNPPEHTKVSPVLVKAAKFLTVYNTYVSTYEDLSATFMQTLEKNMKLRDFMESFIRRHINKGTILDIKSLMMEPVQRIPRYQLLLKEYKKHQEKYFEFTKEVYPDYEDTVKALELTQGVAANANTAILLQEKQKAMDDLISKVSGIDLKDLVTPDRKLIKQELLMKANRNNYEMRLFVLFSDVLMHFAVLSENSSYLFKQKLELAYLKVETHKNKEDRELIIRSKDKSLTIICKDTHQQTDWFEAIGKATSEHRTRLFTIGKLDQGVSSLGHTAPVWIRDDTVSACQIPGCDRKFSFLRRYHHCRACGKAICSRCSETAFVPYRNKRDRVCLICYDELEKCPMDKKKYRRYLKEGDIYAVPADKGDISGFLEALSGGTWKTSVYALRRCVLYEYMQRNDIRAISTRPLISWRVNRLGHDVNHRPAEFCFKLDHDNMDEIIFRANSREDRENWVALLESHVMGVPLNVADTDTLKKNFVEEGPGSK